MSTRFNLINFFREVLIEAKKIVWPSRKEAVMSMISVCIMVLLFSILLFFVDKIVEYSVWSIVGLFQRLLG